MNREILGDILKRMSDDGQPQENMGKVAAHYNSLATTEEESKNPNNEHKNSDGSWKTAEQIWEELQVKKEKGSQTNGATVEPQIVSEDSELASEDGSSVSQDVKPDQVIEQGGYEYKFGVDKDGQAIYYTKKKGAKDWSKVDPEVKDGNITNPAYVSIGQEFNHFDKDAFNREDYLKQQQAQKEIEHKRNNPTSIQDMGLTANPDGSYFRNEDRFVNVDGKWYKQPLNGLGGAPAEGYNGKPVSGKFAKQLNSVLSVPEKINSGVESTPEEIAGYLKPNLNNIKTNNIKKLNNSQNVWMKGLSESERLKVLKLSKDDDFDHRNTVTWVDKNEATVREGIESKFAGVNVEEVGAGNAIKINAPWRSKPYYVDLVPGDKNFKNTQAILDQFTKDHADQGSNVNRSLATVLGERQLMSSNRLSDEGVDGANEIFAESDLDYSITINKATSSIPEMILGLHESYTLKTPKGEQEFKNANEMTAWLYKNLSPEEYDKMDSFMLDQRTVGIDKMNAKVNSELASLSDEEVNDSYWTSGRGKESVMFDLDQGNYSDVAKAAIKASLEKPIMYNRNEGLGSTNVRMVPKEGWEQERYKNLLTDLKGKIPEEDYVELQSYVKDNNVNSAERLADEKKTIANQKGNLAFETYVGHKENVVVRISAKDMTNKSSTQIEQEKNGFVADYQNAAQTVQADQIMLERSMDNINLNMKRDGCGVQTYGDGDDMTVVVSHPDPKKQKYYQGKLEKIMKQSRTLKAAGTSAGAEFDKKYKNWQDKHVDANLDDDKLKHLVNKEYDGTKIVTQDFLDGFRSFGYNIPAAFNNDWAVEQAGNFNTAKSSFQTKLTMDQAADLDQIGFTSWRTFNQQAGNMVVATATSFVVPGGAFLGITGATATTAGLYGMSSAGGKRVDLMGRNERGEKAKKDLDELTKLYKDGKVGKEEYKKQAMALSNTIDMGGIDSGDIWKSSIWSGVTEAGVMLVAGTAVNAMKFKGLMSGSFSNNVGDQIIRGPMGRVLNFASGTVGMISSEMVEEFSALGLDKVGDAFILGDDVWEDLPGELKETFYSTIISSGGMGAFGNAYSNITAHVANGPARNQWFNEIKPELKSIENAIINLEPNSPTYMKDMKFLQDAKMEQVRKVVNLSKETELDALRLGPEAVQKLMVANKNLQGLYGQAGVVAGDSEAVIEEKVQKHIKKLPGELFGFGGEKADYKKVLDISRKQVAKINGEFDYGDDKSAHKVDYNVDGSVKSEGSVHKMFGVEGVAIAEKLIKKDPKFLDLSAKEKAVAVMQALKEKRDTKQVNALKKDTKMKESVEREVYKNAEGEGITKAEWLVLNDKKRVPTDLKAQEDAMYNTVGQYANARKGEALVLANQGQVSAASMLQDQSLSGLEINQANGVEDLKQKVYQAVNDGLITEEKADEIILGIGNGSVKAAILGNKYITTDINATQKAVAAGNLLAGTAISHEIGHFIDDTSMDAKQRESYAGHLNDYMANSMPSIHKAAIDRNSMFSDDSRYIPDLPFENQTPEAKDEYTKSVQDELRQNKNISYLNKVKKQSSTGFLSRMVAKTGVDFNINNKNDAAAWMGSYLTGFEKGEVGLLQQRKLANANKEVDLNKDGYRKSSDLQSRLEQRSINEDGTPRPPTKADAEAMASEMLTQTPNGEFANGVLDSELAQQIGGIVENITKKLYDPIASDARNGVSRNDFKEAAVVKGWELMHNEYLKGEKTMKLDGYMSFLLNERSKDIASSLGIESTVEYGGRGIDVNIDDTKGLFSDMDAEDAFKQEVEDITDPELPLSENIGVSTENEQVILNQAIVDVGVKLPAVDKEVSKNKFTTPFIAALKKAFGVKNGPIHKAMLSTIGNTKAEVETFLKDPKKKMSVLRSMPTNWLASNIPSAVQKSVGGTRVKNDDGTNTFTPNWTNDWQGQKIDRWNAADVGPHRGNTSGPQVMKRHPNAAIRVTNAEMLSKFAKGETMTDIRRNGLDKLAMAMGQEYGLETFKNDLNNDGPMSEVFKGRQDLFDRVLAENHVEEITRQMQRGTAKFSQDGSNPNNLIGDALVQEHFLMLKDLVENSPKGGFKTDKELQHVLAGYSPASIAGFKASGIYDTFGKTKKYIETVKSMDWGDDYAKEKQDYIEGAKSDLRSQREVLSRTVDVLADALPASVLKALGGSRFFGLGNPRVLDGAGMKRKTGKPGEYNKLANKINDKANKSSKEVELPFDPAQVTIFNSKTGLMADAQKILDMDISKEEKLKRLEEIQPAIDSANVHNTKALKYIIEQLALAVENDPSLSGGVAALFQSGSGNVLGIRGLTGLSMMKVMDKSQAPYLTKTDKPTQTNTLNDGGSINRNHPEFQRAYDMANGDMAKVGELLKSKGEHIDPSAPLQAKMFKATLDLASKLKLHKDTDARAQIIQEHNNDMDLLLSTYHQTLGPKIDSDIQDNRLGTTAAQGYARNYAVNGEIKNYVDVMNGGTAASLIQDQAVALVQKINQNTRLNNITNDKAKSNARASQGESVGMSAFDFDETLIDKGENTIIATKDGETITITSGQWPIQGPKLAAAGYDFNFDDFINVRGGVEGPLMQKFRNRINKYGIENNYILTARPMEAAPAIQAWLAQQGIDMPLENITGLGNSTGEAKAQWMLGKFAEGYNDMYFVDDALPNVQAVQNVIDQLDIKGKASLVRLSQSDPSIEFNKIIEDVADIGAEKEFSEAKARQRGENKGLFRIFIPPSAEDFKGLLYNFLGKGAKGEGHLKFFKDNLIDPYAKAQRQVDAAQQALSNDYRNVKKTHKPVIKKLNKKLPGTEFTVDQGVRVLLWDRAGYGIPGLSVTDKNKILAAVKNDPALIAYANDLSIISKQENGYSKPGEFWTTENIGSDLAAIVQEVGRGEFLKPFQENREKIFGKWVGKKLVGPNMNKIEAAFGLRFVEALNDMLWRMENGSNRSFGENRLVNSFANWVNNSVGAIMFFNARSAVLQTLSSVNFINFGDNNIFAASKAFANQPQFWKDFSMIFNSDMLKQRRAGLKTDVNQSEIAAIAKKNGGNPKAVIEHLLRLGFLPTQIADSFAIAIGGSTFYRNRINALVKQGMSKAQAESQAFIDFQEKAEETQQSSRPDLISQQQASALGRLILAFQNTPMQYARLTKKAALDLINRRGSDKQNISKIIYYGAVQNLIFSSLQSAMFKYMFDDEDDEEAQKASTMRVANGMVDSFLRGTGVYGAIAATLKNMIRKFISESERGGNMDQGKVLLEGLNISPPIGSKARKLYSAMTTYKYKNEEMYEMDKLDINNPMYQTIGNTVSALTNFPLDRIVKKTNNISEAMNQNNEAWQRVAMSLGWNTWDIGVENQAVVASGERIKETKKIEKKAKKDAKKASEAKEKERLRKEQEAREVQCSAKIRKGKGPRCKNQTENKNGKCYAHQ